MSADLDATRQRHKFVNRSRWVPADGVEAHVDRGVLLAKFTQMADALRIADLTLSRHDDGPAMSARSIIRHALKGVPDRDGTSLPTCTGISARWCPVHGDCACDGWESHEGPDALSQMGCPLHAPDSPHGEVRSDG